MCSVNATAVSPVAARARSSISKKTGSPSVSLFIPGPIAGDASNTLFIRRSFLLTPTIATEPVWAEGKKLRFKNDVYFWCTLSAGSHMTHRSKCKFVFFPLTQLSFLLSFPEWLPMPSHKNRRPHRLAFLQSLPPASKQGVRSKGLAGWLQVLRAKHTVDAEHSEPRHVALVGVNGATAKGIKTRALAT